MEIKKIVEGMTAPQVAKVIEDNFNEADKKKADKTELSELGQKVFGSTFVNEFDGIAGYVKIMLDHPLSVGDRIVGLDAPDGSVVFLGDLEAALNISALEFPYTLSKAYTSVFCSSTGAYKLTCDNGTDVKGLKGEVEELRKGKADKEKVEALESSLNTIETTINGVNSTFENSFEGIAGYETINLSRPLNIGDRITGLTMPEGAVVYLGNGSASFKISNLEFPYTLDKSYTTAHCSSTGVYKLICDEGKNIDGIRDDVEVLKKQISDKKETRGQMYIMATDTDIEILVKMKKAFDEGNMDIFFEKSHYVIKDAYNYMVENYGWIDKNGLPIGGGNRYYFNGSTFTSVRPENYTGQVINTFDTIRSASDFELHDVIIKPQDAYYLVHDESEGKDKPYYHLYDNVLFDGEEYLAIGCGTGYDATICLNNCSFLGRDNWNIHGPTNNVDNKSVRNVFEINGCYFKGQDPPIWLNPNTYNRERDVVSIKIANSAYSMGVDELSKLLCAQYIAFNNEVIE